MKRPSTFARNATAGRIDEEVEHFDDSSSSEDYEGQLIPAPGKASRPGANSNLFDAELAGGKAAVGSDDEAGGPGGADDNDADDDDGIEDEAIYGAAEKEDAIRERISHSQDQMKHLLELFDDDQLRRYETFRRVGFPRQAIKKLMVKTLDQQVNQNSVIVVAGIAKVYVGELVEEARRVMEGLGEDGPVQPSHLLEAQRRLKAAGLSSSSSIYRRTRNHLF